MRTGKVVDTYSITCHSEKKKTVFIIALAIKTNANYSILASTPFSLK